ncbi:dolichyl-phosphate-mannose-protein mannosyltransferase [Dyadobacter jejuensis]|uniref:Dolichyl-phosphate-mannose-protein mannosyltransferase n=1 Tax=Dyadobacter jejuensis TaxID=1082580 RepID=A0A316ANI6_9BACT|nr:glycosyltransferase family 39 protein [Dyadobacter jejuensis]PWJ59293.1 dolichyl-phosphate-mannose-protein mannosyltransferase [Dyadobacter jejuensis]
MVIFYWIAFLVFIIGIGGVAKRIASPSLSEWLIICFTLFTGTVVPTGFLLSALDLTASTLSWILVNFALLGIHYLLWTRLSPGRRAIPLAAILSNRVRTFKVWYLELSTYLKFLFLVMISTFIVVAITNLILVLFTVPNEWDSMTGHLNRAVRYIQRGTMAHFGGTNWNMDTYPKSVTAIQIYTYLISGKIENAFKFIHHIAYYITLASVFGIAQRIGRNLSASLFCALAYGFFLDFLMQAVTTETDSVLAAYLSCLLYFLFSFYATKENKYLYLSGMVFGLVLGHKVTFVLLMPSVFVIMLYTVFLAPSFAVFFQRFLKLSISIGLALMVYTLPTGYIKNIQVFGHPIGPPTALKHQSVERAGTIRNWAEQGSRNVVRYGYDFFNLDGIRNAQWGYDLNTVIRKPIVFLEDKLQMGLDEETSFTIIPFSFQRRFDFYNANPYWGIFGFALILPLIVLVFFRVLNSRVHWFLAAAFFLHFAAISYSAAYDPFKGRYFIETGLFGVLFLLLLFSNHRLSIIKPRRQLWKAYIGMVVVLACVSAVMSVYLNVRCLPISAYGHESALTMDRIAYQTFARPDVTKAYQKFDSLVPQDAVVALATINDDFEYPLYGKNLTRKLITINPFEQGLQPIPEEAEYLFYDRSVINDTTKIKALPTDIRLGTDTTMVNLIVKGEDHYLRKLK